MESQSGISEWAKPADTLLKMGRDILGLYIAPRQIEREAKARANALVINAEASAKAEVIVAASKYEIAALADRAAERQKQTALREQRNLEEILEKAIPRLPESSMPEKISHDWFVNFFDKARLVSEDEVQEIWAAVLVAEAQAPGKFSRKTVNILGEMSKEDAESFAALCRCTVEIEGGEIAVFFPYSSSDFSSEVGLTRGQLVQLDALGLIKFLPNAKALNEFPALELRIKYHQHIVRITRSAERQPLFALGQVELTRAGLELSSLPKVEILDGLIARLMDYLTKFNSLQASLEN